MTRSLVWKAVVLGFVIAGCSAAPETESDSDALSADTEALGLHQRGAVFTISNAAEGNSVLAFQRSKDGSLKPAGEFSTEGRGTSASLGSQGALALSDDHRVLVAVNAGSNDITSFRVDGARLRLIDRVPSGGTMPVSVAIHEDLVFVVNAGEPAVVAGFRLRPSGALQPMRRAVQPLSSAASGPAQVGIDPRSHTVVVSEKASNAIDSFQLRADGSLAPARRTASAGMTPFGFAFTPRGDLIVSEAASASMSSYRFDRHGQLSAVSAAVPDLQRAPCWVVTTDDSRFAYTANAGSGSISGYRVTRSGALMLLDADGVTGDAGPGSRPLDMAIDRTQKHLYLLDAGNQGLSEFEIGRQGALTLDAMTLGLPATAAGVAAY